MIFEVGGAEAVYVLTCGGVGIALRCAATCGAEGAHRPAERQAVRPRRYRFADVSGKGNETRRHFAMTI
jgi:hypothetical protein